MDILRVRTPRGLELVGTLFLAEKSDKVLIMMTGICSNVFQNELLYATGKLLSENGITVIIAHVYDSFRVFLIQIFRLVNKEPRAYLMMILIWFMKMLKVM